MAKKISESNYIYKYYDAILDGKETVGKWILLLYKYLVNGIENKKFYFDEKKALKTIKFIENFCHHSKGKLAPGLIELELWQKAKTSATFGIVDADGLRQFREVFTQVGRKCGKSLEASGYAEYMSYADGEFGADTYFLAPKLDQTDIVFNAFWQSIQAEPELLDMTQKRKTDIYIPETNTAIKKIAFSEKKSDGFNPHFTVCDEIAAWQGDKGIKQYEVMTSALGSREQPIVYSITTANYVNDGIYDDLFKRSTRMLLGDSKETRLLPFLYMIDDVEKWNDLNELKKSLPNLGVSVSVDFMKEEIAKAEQSLVNKAEFMCKYCNIKQNSSQAWLTSRDIEKAYTGKQINLEEFRNCYCVGGIDLSQTTDLTAALVVIEKDKKLHIVAKFFMPQERIETATQEEGIPYETYVKRGLLQPSGDHYVDYKDVYNWYKELVEKYKLYPLKNGYDRYSAQYLIQDMKAYGFHMDDVYQGDNLYPAIQEVEGLMKDGMIDIGDNDLLKMHLYNSAIKMSLERGRGRLIKLDSKLHIDGTAALLDAMAVRQKHYDEIGKQLKNDRR